MWVKMRLKLAPLCLVCLAPAISSAEPFSLVPYATGWKPNPAFRPLTTRLRGPTFVGSVQQIGEVVVLEGDDELITTSDMGGFGISVDNGNPIPVTAALLHQVRRRVRRDHHPHHLQRQRRAGALAYEISAQNEARGIGRKVFDESGLAWGAKTKKLLAFVNMMQWNQFGTSMAAITEPQLGLLHDARPGVRAPLAVVPPLHRRQRQGISSAMLGRDAVALGLDAAGRTRSVMDGNHCGTTATATYTVTDVELALLAARPVRHGDPDRRSEVPPFFLIRDRGHRQGRKVNPRAVRCSAFKIQGHARGHHDRPGRRGRG